MLEDALFNAQCSLSALMARSGGDAAAGIQVKELAHVRLHGFPWDTKPSASASSWAGQQAAVGPGSASRPSIGTIGSHHLNKLVSVSGTITRTASVKMFEYKKVR